MTRCPSAEQLQQLLAERLSVPETEAVAAQVQRRAVLRETVP